MKVIYTGIRMDSYESPQRESFEYTNFYLTLKNIAGLEVIHHPFDRILEVGKNKFNQELLDLVRQEKPSLLFAFMYSDELDPEILLKIKNETPVVTIAWFADDYWRFWNYSKHWPPYFSWVVTTYSRATTWYRKAGYQNVILSQWACNTTLYKPVEVKKDIGVSFVGQYKSGRARIINRIEKAGIKVETFGLGWPGGKISHEEMLSVFSRSKINLNITARSSLLDPRVIGRIFFRKSIDKVRPDFHLVDNFRAYLHFRIHHTHARPFELAGCKAFTISGFSEDIGHYYNEGEEMIFYYRPSDLIDKIRYYLPRESERNKIAEAAYLRTIQSHTYEKRLRDIFRQVGLKI